MPALLLIRHCETTGQSADSPLTPKGQADALALAAPLKSLGIDAAYSSPYGRAVATIAPAAAACGLELKIDARLRERAVHWIDGREEWLAHITRGMAEPDYKLDDEESFAETAARGLAALADIAAAGHTLPAIASHGQALSAILRSADPNFGVDQWRTMRNPHLFLADWRDGRLAKFKAILEPSGLT